MTDTIIATLFTAGISALGYILARYSQGLEDQLADIKKQQKRLEETLIKLGETAITHEECEKRRTDPHHPLLKKLKQKSAKYVRINDDKE